MHIHIQNDYNIILKEREKCEIHKKNASDGSYYIKTELVTCRSLANHATYSKAILCYMSRFLNGIIKARGRPSNYMSDGKIGRTEVFFSLTDKDE